MADRSNGQQTVTRWGFIGSGKMATALMRGMIRAGTALPTSIVASDTIPEAREALARETGIRALASNAEVAEASDVLVLAVKPQSMTSVLAELAPHVDPRHLVVSIAAGISLAKLDEGLGEAKRRIVRVMPNTPALIGQGASGYCLGEHALEGDEATVRVCLDAAGRSYRVPESLMDAVTGLSGSGPAFAYLMIEALSDGGVRAGLPRDVATALAAQTLLGSAAMVLETGLHPGALKDQVTSPGGTTIAGVHALERGGLRAALMDAVMAAAARSAELGSK
ncbi:pyrroline-5-carboxylate reductase [Isosphaeraceae bacterium EP7]